MAAELRPMDLLVQIAAEAINPFSNSQNAQGAFH